MGYLVGVDLGTSGTKTVLFDPSGRALAGATAEYPLYQPEIGWAEQDPDDWWRAVCETIAAVIKKSGVNTRDIRALGLSGQMHGLVLLDRDGAVLRRSIIWCDQRTGRECDQIHERVGRERLIRITANPALTGFTASKLLWVRNHEPGIFERTAKVLLPKDYIRYRLTGEYATEVSGASGTQFLDVSRRAWSAEVLDRLGIPADWMPAVYESYEISGRLTRQAAALLAGVGAGVYGSVPEACDAAVRPGEEVQPDERSARVYRRLYPIYRGLYAQLKPSYDRLAETLREE